MLMSNRFRLVCALLAMALIPAGLVSLSSSVANAATPSTVNIRLLASQKNLAVDAIDASAWYSTDPLSPAYVKYVVAGSTITLTYVVTDTNGAILPSQQVTLYINNPNGSESATFANANGTALAQGSGIYGYQMTGTTNSLGRVTFTVRNTNTTSQAESARVVMNEWKAPSNQVELKGGFYPSIGAAVEHVDRFWPHIVKSSVPTPPASVGVIRGNKSVTVIWADSVSDGGSSVSGYVALATSPTGLLSSEVVSANANAVTISGLTNNATYQVKVKALNGIGPSPWSDIVYVVPSTVAAKVPSAPAIGAITASTRTLSVPYSVGAENGATITRVEYSVNGGATWVTTTDNPIVIDGLTNGLNYTVRLRAVNPVGPGAARTKAAKPIALVNYMSVSPPSPMAVGDSDQTLYALSSSGSVVFASLAPAICTIVNGALHAVKAGSCSIKVTSPSDAYYAAATSVIRTVRISASTSPSPTPGAGQNCSGAYLWCDDFEGTSVSSSNWTQVDNDGCSTVPVQCGFGNNEYQWYSPAANTLETNTVSGTAEKALVITARPLATPKGRCRWGATNSCTWSAGKLTTMDHVGFMYGRIEAMIRMPAGTGTVPAFWMLGADFPTVSWPQAGEIDIVEAPAVNPKTVWTTLHMPRVTPLNGDYHLQYPSWDCASSCNRYEYSANLSSDFHRYGMEWFPTHIDFYFDGIKIKSVTKAQAEAAGGKWVFSDREYYVMLNNAINEDDYGWAGHISSATNGTTMKVAYVRYSTVSEGGKTYGTLTLH